MRLMEKKVEDLKTEESLNSKISLKIYYKLGYLHRYVLTLLVYEMLS